MTRSDIPPSLDLIRKAATIPDHLYALKQLKNDIIGHEQRKASLVREGVIPSLVGILGGVGKSRGKGRVSGNQHAYAYQDTYGAEDAWSEEDQLRLQSVFILASLANAGNPFIPPLIAGGLIPQLLSLVAPGAAPLRLTVEALRTLVTIVSQLWYDPLDSYQQLYETVADQLIRPQSPLLESIVQTLQRQERSTMLDHQLIQTLSLIRYTASRFSGPGIDRQNVLVSAGILDLLAFRFSMWAYAHKDMDRAYDSVDPFPVIIPPFRALYAPLARAIAAVVGDSPYRAARFFSSAFMQQVFADTPDVYTRGETEHTPSDSTALRSVSQWNRFLPQVAPSSNTFDYYRSYAFPPLTPTRDKSDTVTSDVVHWLIHIARCTTGDDRIASIWLLATLILAGNLSVQYERRLALLVVPLVVQVFSAPSKDDDSTFPGSMTPCCEAMASLAFIIKSNATLQQAAEEADAVKSLCNILKQSFDPVKVTKRMMWSPKPARDPPEEGAFGDACRLGPQPLPLDYAKVLFTRTSAMNALSIVAQIEDSIRNDVIKHGAMQAIIDSLNKHPNPYPSDLRLANEPVAYPTTLILAALELLRALSRSITILRTSLIDANVAMPVLELSKSKNSHIRLHAVYVLTNMILQFSPMKEELMRNGACSHLCELAKSANAETRISALWAIKHMVVAAKNPEKMQVLEELGTGFILNLLSGEASVHKSHLAVSKFNGEKVDILNDEPEMEVDGPLVSSDDEPSDEMTTPSARSIRAKFGPDQDWLARIRPMKNAEQNPVSKAKREEVQIQYQAMDIIRNMFAEPTAPLSELLDQVLGALGSPKFFDILIAKLKPKSGVVTNGSSGHTAGKRPTLTVAGGSANVPPTYIDADNFSHADIVQSVLYTFAHIANGRGPHRTMVLNQNGFVQAITPHFNHPNAKVRVSALWIVHNLLWVDDAADSKQTRQRALDMRRAGLEDKCRELQSDAELDVRERAKGAVETFIRLLGQPPSSVHPSRVWD